MRAAAAAGLLHRATNDVAAMLRRRRPARNAEPLRDDGRAVAEPRGFVNATRHHLCMDTLVDGRKIDSLSLDRRARRARDEQTSHTAWTWRIATGSAASTATRAARTRGIARRRPMRFRARQVEEGGPRDARLWLHRAHMQGGPHRPRSRGSSRGLGDKKMCFGAWRARGEDARLGRDVDASSCIIALRATLVDGGRWPIYGADAHAAGVDRFFAAHSCSKTTRPSRLTIISTTTPTILRPRDALD